VIARSTPDPLGSLAGARVGRSVHASQASSSRNDAPLKRNPPRRIAARAFTCRRLRTLCRARMLALSRNIDGLPSAVPVQDGNARAEHEHEESEETDVGNALDHARCGAQRS
jgi:hypothetical protein